MDFTQIQSNLADMAAAGEFSGCVSFSKGKETLFTAFHGMVVRGAGLPINIDTRFNIASVGKPIAAAATLQCVQRGLFALDDPIGGLLPDGLLPGQIGKLATVEHLLTHTAGLGDYFAPAWDGPARREYACFDDYADIVGCADMAFTPGEKWDYSNLGYLLLGRIIEEASGLEYFDYLKANVFAPAGMASSGAWLYDEPLPNRAVGYSYDEAHGVWRASLRSPVVRGTAAGGWHSTVGDLRRFMDALLSFDLLEEERAKSMFHPKMQLHSPYYGYGFFLADGKHSHGGDGRGICARLAHYADGGYVLSVLCNIESGAADVERMFDELLFGNDIIQK